MNNNNTKNNPYPTLLVLILIFTSIYCYIEIRHLNIMVDYYEEQAIDCEISKL